MSKRTKKLKKTSVPPATEVEVELRVTIKEIHTRTSTVCDKRSNTFIFDFGHNFEAARAWLESGETWTDVGDMCAEAREQFDAWQGATR